MTNSKYPSSKYPDYTHLDYKGDVVKVPWPYVTQRDAARALGVAVEYLQGLANNPIPAIKVVSNKGNGLYLFQQEAIDALAEKLGR